MVNQNAESYMAIKETGREQSQNTSSLHIYIYISEITKAQHTCEVVSIPTEQSTTAMMITRVLPSDGRVATKGGVGVPTV